MADKKRVGVVGEREAVLAFRALGMRVIAAEDTESVERAIQKLVHESVPVIFITERACTLARDLVAHYQGDPAVSIIPIPGSRGTDGTGMQHVKANVEKAIGADILFKNDKEEK
jgi:V/A-type H+-transporting ATPase subunit F